MNVPLDWLLSGAPWVQYRTRLDLLGETERSKDVKAARQAMLDHPQVQALISELRDWPGPPLTRHNDASHLLHKLVFLADLGVRATDPGVDRIVDRVLDHPSAEGVFQVKVNIADAFRRHGPGSIRVDVVRCAVDRVCAEQNGREGSAGESGGETSGEPAA